MIFGRPFVAKKRGNENISPALWFMNDDTPAPYSVVARRWLVRVGSRFPPARSPDLNPLDYFHWGYLNVEDLRNRMIMGCNETRSNRESQRGEDEGDIP